MSNFTSGPWEVGEYQRGVDKEIHIYGPSAIVDYDDVNHDEQEANARLIAAAPTLLDACEAALNYCSDFTTGQRIADKLRAAIAKARGETP